MFTSEYAHDFLPTPLKNTRKITVKDQKHCCHRLVYFRHPGKECWTAHSTVLSNHDRSFYFVIRFTSCRRALTFHHVSVRWSQVYKCCEWHKPATWSLFVNERLTLALILIYNRNINIFSLYFSRPPFCLCTLASASTLSVAEVKTLTHWQIIAQ